jgi:hypothetical protein
MCCLGCVALVFPRVALAIMWLTGYGSTAFMTVLWPVLGFCFMPYTTCAYAVGMNERGAIDGWALALVILGVILDAGSHGGSGASTTRRYRRVHIHTER